MASKKCTINKIIPAGENIEMLIVVTRQTTAAAGTNPMIILKSANFGAESIAQQSKKFNSTILKLVPMLNIKN